MPTLQEQLEWWTKQAEHDLEMAKSNRQNGFHESTTFS
jgi:HEPN domain-containing protein